MRNVILVTQQQLQGVAAGRQVKARLGLPETEMQMVVVVWYWLIQWRQIGIDDQVMMTGIGLLNASRCDAAPLNPMRTQKPPLITSPSDGQRM